MPGTEPKFTVEIYHDLAPYLGGMTSKVFFQDVDQLINAWKIATEWTLDTFHGRLAPRIPTAAPNSYAHLVCLGAPLHYSEDAEPNISPAADSLEDAIALLEEKRGMDFTGHPLFQWYADASRRVKEVFPEAPQLAGMGFEGPITSAALFRGQDFYCDVMDEPDLVKRYLSLMTESVLAFKEQLNTFVGLPAVSDGGGSMPDDLAAMLSPSLWDEMVIPFWKQYYDGFSTGKSRFLHCEALVPAHLPYLKKAGITHYQPSVSPQLTLENMRTHANDWTFDWLLYAYQVTDMDDEQMEKWVADAVAAGANNIRTQFGAYAVSIGKVDRIQKFLDIAESYQEK